MADVATLAERARTLTHALLDGDAGAARAALAELRAPLEHALATATVPAHAAALGEALARVADGEPGEIGERYFDRALAIAEPDPRARAAVLGSRARTRYLLGRYADAAADAALALAALDGCAPDDPQRLRTLLVASVTDRDTGELARAQQRAASVARAARVRGDRHLEAWAELHAASATLMLGDIAAAAGGYERALRAAHELGMRRVAGLATTNLGHCALDSGDLSGAEVHFSAAAELFREIGDVLMLNKCQVRIARLVLDRGAVAEARALASASEAKAERIDDRDTAVRAAIVLGRAQLAEALAQAEENGWVSLTTHPLPWSGLVSREARPLERARDATLIAADASWFEPPGRARVDLRRRVPLRRVLAFLLAHRLADPGTAVTTDALASAGWPDERIQIDAARDRVYATIAMLCRLGLGRVLVRHDGGYALDRAQPIAVSDCADNGHDTGAARGLPSPRFAPRGL